MAKSFNEYPNQDGKKEIFSVSFGYLSRTFVHVFVGGVSTEFVWKNTSSIKISPAPKGTVRIIRETPISVTKSRLVRPSVLLDSAEDFNHWHMVHRSEEAEDRFQALERRTAALKKYADSISKQPGPKGDRGEPGPLTRGVGLPGPRGPRGHPGPGFDASILGTAAYENLYVGTTPPNNPQVGDLWIDIS